MESCVEDFVQCFNEFELPVLTPHELQTIFQDSLLPDNAAECRLDGSEVPTDDACSISNSCSSPVFEKEEPQSNTKHQTEVGFTSVLGGSSKEKGCVVGDGSADPSFLPNGHRGNDNLFGMVNRDSQHSQNNLGVTNSRKANVGGKKKKIMLDDFLWALLQDETYISCIQWTLKERLEFKFSRPEMVAKLWGDFKRKKLMNYEKLSRGLRYYYHSKKLERIQHKHYHFRFLKTKENEHIKVNLKGEKDDGE